MKKYIIILLCALVSCKGQSSDNKYFQILEHPNTTNSIETQKNDLCEDKLKTLIITSTNFENPFQKELNAHITNSEGDVYTISLYTIDTGENSQNTVGWIKLNIKDRTLTDNTNDPQEGIILKYDKKLYELFVTQCLAQKPISEERTTDIELKNIKECKLPLDFDEYYKTCIYPAEAGNCENRYPKYSFDQENDLTKTLRGNGITELPSEYIFLPTINKSIQPLILCYTDRDNEQYQLITIKQNKIVGNLEIGNMSDNITKWFNIGEDYKITIYKSTTDNRQKKVWKLFSIDNNDGAIKNPPKQ